MSTDHRARKISRCQQQKQCFHEENKYYINHLSKYKKLVARISTSELPLGFALVHQKCSCQCERVADDSNNLK